MLDTIWRWFYRGVLLAGVLCLILAALLVWGMNRPLVRASEGYISADKTPPDITLCGSLPQSAKDVRYVCASVGMGGRFRAYRFSASLDELHAHAAAEFANHWDKPAPTRSDNGASPFSVEDMQRYRKFYHADVDWMVAPEEAIGTLYASADGQSSHRPTIFVDEVNAVLYFLMTD